MKKVVFSFDDGRLDTYTKAYAILKKYGMPFTLNVCTDFIKHQENYTCFKSAGNKSVSIENLLEMQENGVEIASHGHLHLNTKDDILNSIAALEQMGINVENVGFASPNSGLTYDNAQDVLPLVESGIISYIRSGIQVRREGLLYSLLTYLERKTHSVKLFRYLNKKNVITDEKAPILMSVAVLNCTTVKQIVSFIDKMNGGESVIFMLHSVIDKNDIGYGSDSWYFDAEKFNELCELLSKRKDVLICTTRDLVSDK